MSYYEDRVHAYTDSSSFGIDATPGYLDSIETRDRIATLYADYRPRLRFIIALRDPVVRAFSHFRFALKLAAMRPESTGWAVEATQGRTFDQFVTDELDGFHLCQQRRGLACDVHKIIRYGLYDQRISEWMSLFPASSFCIVSTVGWSRC